MGEADTSDSALGQRTVDSLMFMQPGGRGSQESSVLVGVPLSYPCDLG